jgi:cobalamin biosynthesis Mg chelatase CobN
MARAADPSVELHHPVFDEHPPLRVWSWRDGSHGVLLARLDETTGLIWATGEAGETSVDVFEEGLRTLLSRPNMVLFWDLEKLDRYAPKTRRMIVELLAAERKKLERIHLLSDKAMIAMAASAVNLVLGGILQVHREREPWNTALRKHLAGMAQSSTASGSRPAASASTASASTASASTASASTASASTASASTASASTSASTSAVSSSSSSSSAWRKKFDDPPPSDSGERWKKR